jgi:hypothetical protein
MGNIVNKKIVNTSSSDHKLIISAVQDLASPKIFLEKK